MHITCVCRNDLSAGLSRYFSTVVATQNYININTTASVCIKSIRFTMVGLWRADPLQSISTQNFSDGTRNDVYSKFSNESSMAAEATSLYIFRYYYNSENINISINIAIYDYYSINAWHFIKSKSCFRQKSEFQISCMIAILFPDFWELELLFLKDERNLEIFSGFDLGIRFLSTRSKHSISRGRISMPSLADCLLYLGRSSFYLQPRARLARCIPRRSTSLRMRSIAEREELRNIGKWFWKVRLCVRWGSTIFGAVQVEIVLIDAKKSSRRKSCFTFKESLSIDNDWWVSIKDRSKYSRMHALIKIQDTNFAK